MKIAGVDCASVLGLAVDVQTLPTAGVLVPVALISPGFVYKTTADADASTHVLAAKLYDINATTQYVDVGDAANGCIIILETDTSVTDVNVMFTIFDLGAS